MQVWLNVAAIELMPLLTTVIALTWLLEATFYGLVELCQRHDYKEIGIKRYKQTLIF